MPPAGGGPASTAPAGATGGGGIGAGGGAGALAFGVPEKATRTCPAMQRMITIDAV